MDWVVRKHLTYLKDPVKIAEHVRRTLDKGRFDEAYALTKRASAGTKVVVCWNHLIEYRFREQQLRGAIKLYNEVGVSRP